MYCTDLPNILTVEATLALVRSLILSHFKFCPTVWHYCSISDTKKMEKLQERAVRYVVCNYQSPYKELPEKACVSKLFVDQLRTAMCEVFKVVNDIGPDYLKKYFTIKDSFYVTRATMPLVLPKFRSATYGKRNCGYEGTLFWNNLENYFKFNKFVKEFRYQTLRWDGSVF